MRRSDVESIICCQRHACAFGCQKPTFTIGWQGLACRGKYSDTTITLLADAVCVPHVFTLKVKLKCFNLYITKHTEVIPAARPPTSSVM
eukprot:1137487-Pelagomonas_calceolata.AAC.3